MGSRIGYERELEKNGALWLTEDNTEYYPGKLYTQEEFVPRTDYFTVYFTPQREQTELIFQYSWFNHQHGNFKEKLIAGQQIVVNYNGMQFLGNA